MPLHFKVFGEGPPLLLIHGLFGSLENLGVLSRALSQQFTVYAIDLPEHGQSPHSASTSIRQLSEQVKLWLREQALSQLAMVGHSLGGKVAMELALSDPSLVSRVAVLDIAPVQYTPHHDAIFEGLNALQPASLASRNEADKQLSDYVAEPAVRSFLLKNLEKRDGHYAWKMNLPVLHRDYRHLLQSNRQGQYSNPVLFIRGGRSEYILEQHHPDIYARFPQATIEQVAAGHWLHAEKPQQVLALLQAFLEQ